MLGFYFDVFCDVCNQSGSFDFEFEFCVVLRRVFVCVSSERLG